MAALVLAVLLLLGLTAPALAAPVEGPCTLQLTFAPEGTAAEGVAFTLYRVATVDQTRATFTPIDPYGGYHVLDAPVDWLDRADTLVGYVLRDDLPAAAQANTDENGVVRFEDLEQGLYLIMGEPFLTATDRYTPTPCFLSLPNSYDGGDTWTATVAAEMKSEREELPTVPLERHARKVWSDPGHTDRRPAQVVVDLLKDGAVYDTQALSEENNWRYDWTGLDPAAQWRLVERDPGADYAPTVTRVGVTFLVTNTYRGTSGGNTGGTDPTPSPSPSAPPSAEPSQPPEEEDLEDPDVPLEDLIGDPDDPTDPTDPQDPDVEDLEEPDTALTGLPQTGQLWWPVPLLAILGVGLILCGLIRRRREEARYGDG